MVYTYSGQDLFGTVDRLNKIRGQNQSLRQGEERNQLLNRQLDQQAEDNQLRRKAKENEVRITSLLNIIPHMKGNQTAFRSAVTELNSLTGGNVDVEAAFGDVDAYTKELAEVNKLSKTAKTDQEMADVLELYNTLQVKYQDRVNRPEAEAHVQKQISDLSGQREGATRADLLAERQDVRSGESEGFDFGPEGTARAALTSKDPKTRAFAEATITEQRQDFDEFTTFMQAYRRDHPGSSDLKGFDAYAKAIRSKSAGSGTAPAKVKMMQYFMDTGLAEGPEEAFRLANQLGTTGREQFMMQTRSSLVEKLGGPEGAELDQKVAAAGEWYDKNVFPDETVEVNGAKYPVINGVITIDGVEYKVTPKAGKTQGATTTPPPASKPTTGQREGSLTPSERRRADLKKRNAGGGNFGT